MAIYIEHNEIIPKNLCNVNDKIVKMFRLITFLYIRGLYDKYLDKETLQNVNLFFQHYHYLSVRYTLLPSKKYDCSSPSKYAFQQLPHHLNQVIFRWV